MAVHARTDSRTRARRPSHGPVSRGGGSPWLGAGWIRAFWVSARFGGTAILITMLIRHLLGFPHPYSAEVAATFGLTFGAIGFTVGIGCFDYWCGYIIGKPTGAGGPLRSTARTRGATTSGSTPTTR